MTYESTKAGKRHLALRQLVKTDPRDYQDWGLRVREQIDGGFLQDCSAGCKHACLLDGDLGADWLVCGNPKSHRAGLLTFEHQGCDKFERDEEPDDEDDDAEIQQAVRDAPRASQAKASGAEIPRSALVTQVGMMTERAVKAEALQARVDEAVKILDVCWDELSPYKVTRALGALRGDLGQACPVCGACVRGWPHCPDGAGKESSGDAVADAIFAEVRAWKCPIHGQACTGTYSPAYGCRSKP